MNNRELATILNNMSMIYRYKGGQERFRTGAYQKAAGVINNLSQPFLTYLKNNVLEELPGIGESIGQKIREYARTGKIKKYEKLKKEVPYELIELLDIRGFGPQSLKQIHDSLHISSKKELIRALQNGSVSRIKGFGKKKVQNMLGGLDLHKTVENRMLLWDALTIGQQVIEWLKKIPQVKKVEFAGSLRRKKETIGDIDLLIASEEKNRIKIINHFTSSVIAKKILEKGTTKASIILKDTERQADIRIVNEDEWGSALQYFTGSKEHNIRIRTMAKGKNYKISEYGVLHTRSNKRVICKIEEDVYAALGLEYIPPEMREDMGELELAYEHKIPKLISLEDIKGDLHVHSTWSDGINSIEEMAAYAKNNLHYEYIVISDHSKSSRIANGMDEKQVLKQIKKIDSINKTLGTNFIKKGIEVDILANGNLDFSNEILSQLDWVTASVHSRQNHNNTMRVISACENPYVHCIGHLTGRLIGSRESQPLELEKIFQSAFQTGTALEINAQPNRMDLNDKLSMLARKKGIKLVINTDAHSTKNLNYIQLGVDIARRAWCKAENILNSKSWSEIIKLTKKKIKIVSSNIKPADHL